MKDSFDNERPVYLFLQEWEENKTSASV